MKFKKKRLYAFLGLVLLACLLPFISASDEYTADHFSNVTLEIDTETYTADHFSNVTLIIGSAEAGIPDITLNAPIDYYNSSSENITFNYTCTDAGIIESTTLYLSNGSSITTVNGTDNETTVNFTINNFIDGVYSWNVTCTDNDTLQGNSTNRNFTVDTTDPVVSVVYPTNTSYSIDVSELNYTIEDTNPDRCWYSTDDGVTNLSIVSAGTNFTSVVASEGSNNWIVYCNDSANNLGQDNVTFFQDNVTPQIAIVYPENTTYYDYITELNYTYNETNADTCWWTDDLGVTNNTITCGDNVTGMSSDAGSNTWIVYINDTVGHSASASISFTIDFPDVNVTLNSPGNDTTQTTSSVTFNCTAEAGSNEDKTPDDYECGCLTDCDEAVDGNWATKPTDGCNDDNIFMNRSFTDNYNSAEWTAKYYSDESDVAIGWCYNYTSSDWIEVLNSDNYGGEANVTVSIPSDCLSSILQTKSLYHNTGVGIPDTWFYEDTVVFSETVDVINVSLIIDDVINETNTSGIEGDYIFTKTLAEGDHTWTCNATDTYNQITTADAFDLTIDLPNWATNNYTFYTYDMILNITNPADSSFVEDNSSIDLNFTYSINGTASSTLSNCIYWTSDGSISNTSIVGCTNTSFTLPDGNYLLNLWVEDNHGNTQNDTTNFTIDVTAPQIAFIDPTTTNDTFVCDNIVINVSLNETNFENITYGLYNHTSGAVVNETTYFTEITSLNFTVTDRDDYDFNVTSCDNSSYCTSTETRTATVGACYDLDIALSDGITIFVFNVTNTTGTFQPYYQTPTLGILNVSNNESITLDIVMKFNETSDGSNITVKANDVYDFDTAVTVEDSYVEIINDLAAGNDNMIWMWAVYNDTRRIWLPDMDVVGI